MWIFATNNLVNLCGFIKECRFQISTPLMWARIPIALNLFCLNVFFLAEPTLAMPGGPLGRDVKICGEGIELDETFNQSSSNTISLAFSYEGAVSGGAKMEREGKTVTTTSAKYKMPPNCLINNGCWPDGTTAVGESSCEVTVTFSRDANVSIAGSGARLVRGSTYSAKATEKFSAYLPKRCRLDDTSRALNNEHNRMSSVLCAQAAALLESSLKIRSTCPNPRIDTNSCTRRCCNKLFDRRVPNYYRVLPSTDSEIRTSCQTTVNRQYQSDTVREDCLLQCISNTKNRGITCPDANPPRNYCANDDSNPSCKYYPIP